MDSVSNNLLGNLQGVQGVGNSFENGLTEPGVAQAGKADFGELFSQALDNVNGLQQTANDSRERFEMGDRSISIAEVMIAGQKSSLAFDATVQVRNKLVQAYQDIMNMPV